MLSAQSSTTPQPPPTDVLRQAVYAELELRKRKRSWAPTFRGSSLIAQTITDHEWMLAGPAETSKTWAACWRLDTLCRETPKAAAAIVRKVGADMKGTVLRTWELLTKVRGGVTVYGGNKPEWYEYENGTIVYVGGMDRPGKVLSGERDWIYVNQAEELTLDDWEHLTHRCSGRGARTKHPMLFGDCNPDAPTHWIKQRPQLRFLPSVHEDNPALFDDDGNPTEQGVRSMEILDSLTGVRKERLRYGRWVAAEGVVYDGFSVKHHVIGRDDLPKMRRWVGSIDWGFKNPCVFQLWGLDYDDRAYLVREIYRTQRIASDFAEDIKAVVKSEGLRLRVEEKTEQESQVVETIVADHDAEDRATVARCGVPTRAAIKEIGAGIQKVQARLRLQKDGKPRLFFVEDAVVERDADLLARRLPTSTVQEMEVYAWPKGADGKPVKEIPVDVNNHGCDGTRYMTEYVDRAAGPGLTAEERIRADVEKRMGKPEEGKPVEDLEARIMAYAQARAEEQKRSTRPRLLPTNMSRLRRHR